MEDQKVNPVPSCRDTKMDKLLETLTEDFFYANDEKDATVSLDFKAGEPFRFQFFLTDDGMFHLTYKGRRVISNGLMIFYEPGLKGMLAFFYALELGCRNVWLEEYDYFDSYFRLKAATDKGTDSCVITFSDYEYGKSKVRK